MPDDFKFDVFLSHNHADKPRVRWLAERTRTGEWIDVSRLSTIDSQPAAGRRFIPLLLGDCALPDTLRRYKVVDFSEESETAFAKF